MIQSSIFEVDNFKNSIEEFLKTEEKRARMMAGLSTISGEGYDTWRGYLGCLYNLKQHIKKWEESE